MNIRVLLMPAINQFRRIQPDIISDHRPDVPVVLQIDDRPRRRDQDGWHARPMSSFQAERRVFEDQASIGIYRQRSGGLQEDAWIGLPVRQVLSAYDRLKYIFDLQGRKDEIDVLDPG